MVYGILFNDSQNKYLSGGNSMKWVDSARGSSPIFAT